MAEKDRPQPPGADDHEARVHDSFEELRSRLGDRLDDAGRETLEKLRAAAKVRDAEAVRAGLTSLRERHGWLYEELAAHPKLANILDELALWGF